MSYYGNLYLRALESGTVRNEREAIALAKQLDRQASKPYDVYSIEYINPDTGRVYKDIQYPRTPANQRYILSMLANRVCIGKNKWVPRDRSRLDYTVIYFS